MLDGQLKETLFETPTVEEEQMTGACSGLVEKRVQFCHKDDVTYINGLWMI